MEKELDDRLVELTGVADKTDPLVGITLDSRYEIEERVGSGGWATVYRAKQTTLGRPVAIKVLHQHLSEKEDNVRRFAREAQAAMQLNHPNICSVYDYGSTESGQPYMVMEYAIGTPLHDALKKDTLSVSKLLEIFRHVCQALSAAHKAGIVHRDIKPPNIYLTDKYASTKVIDFGLAKFTEEHGHTLTEVGQTIGTPAYMAPEACMGYNVDARSDIYSLGCVMYECLLGERPFEGRNIFETMNQQLRKEIVIDKTKAGHDLPADLQLILLRCLEKDPSRRYQQANELESALADVEKRLAGGRLGGQPQLAQSLALLQSRMRLFLRPKLLHALYTAATVSLAAVLVWVIVSNQTASRQDTSAAYKAHFAAGDHALIAGKYADAVKNLTLAVEDSAPFGEEDARHLQAMERLQQAFSATGKTTEAEHIRQEIALIRSRHMGAMYGDERENANSIAALQKAFDANPSTDTAIQLTQLRNKQAQLLLTNNRYEEAELQLTRALEVEKKAGSAADTELATTQSNLGYVYANTGRYAEAEQCYKQALCLRERLFGKSSGFVAKSLRNLGDFYAKQGRTGEALPLLSRALDIHRAQKSESEIAWDENILGTVYLKQGQLQPAEQCIRAALEKRTKLYGTGALDVGRSYYNLGLVLDAQHKASEAAHSYQKALMIYDRELKPTHPDSVRCAYQLANDFVLLSRRNDAIELYKRVCAATNVDDEMLRASRARLSDLGA